MFIFTVLSQIWLNYSRLNIWGGGDLGFNPLKQSPLNLFLSKLPPYHSYYVFNLSFHTYKIQEVGKLIQEIYVLKIRKRVNICEFEIWKYQVVCQ